MSEARTGRGALIFILGTVLIDSIGLGIIVPVMPRLVMELAGEDLSGAARWGGWLWFTFAIATFFCAPIVGGLSDRFGRRPVLLFSLFTFGIDYLIMATAPTLALLFAGRTLSGISGATFPTAMSYIADVTPPEKRSQTFGLVGGAFGVGFVIGPAIGGLLGELGWRIPFFASAAVAFLNFAYGYFIVPESLDPAHRRKFDWKRANPVGTLLQLRKYPSVLGFAAATFLVQFAFFANPSIWSYYTMLKFDWSEADVGLSVAFVGLLVALSFGLMTRLVIPRIGEARAIVLGLVLGASGFLGYAFATQGWMMYLIAVPACLVGLAPPALRGVMSKQVPPNAQGELNGGIASMESVAAIFAPMILTQLFSYFTGPSAPVYFPGAAFTLASLILAGSLLVALRAIRRHPAPASQAA